VESALARGLAPVSYTTIGDTTAGVASGGKSIEDPPGWREGGNARLYLAYLRDPFGNKICALHRGERQP
jgi:hypothetical protein